MIEGVFLKPLFCEPILHTFSLFFCNLSVVTDIIPHSVLICTLRHVVIVLGETYFFLLMVRLN